MSEPLGVMAVVSVVMDLRNGVPSTGVPHSDTVGFPSRDARRPPVNASVGQTKGQVMHIIIRSVGVEQASDVHGIMQVAFEEYRGRLVPPSGALTKTLEEVHAAIRRRGRMRPAIVIPEAVSCTLIRYAGYGRQRGEVREPGGDVGVAELAPPVHLHRGREL